jgi:putative transposase
VLLSYKYRLYPTRAQAVMLGEMLRDFCSLYNAALEERVDAYRKAGILRTYKDQALELKACRALDIGFERWSFSAEQQVLRRLDKSFKAFFRRCKAGEKPGFPRFRASARYHAAEFRVGDGLTLRRTGRIGLVGIPGEIKCKWHRKLPSPPTSAILSRQNGKWHVVFHVEVESALITPSATIGIDMGLTSLVALSNGETLPRPNFTKRAAKGLRKRSRALARCKRGSKRRRKVRLLKAKYETHVANRRRDYLHKLAAALVKRFGGIGVEDLNIKGLARGMHAKHVNDASWAQLISMLNYKAAKAGGAVVKVDPRGTSQECPECGQIAAKALSDRMHICDCGCVLDRDVAAAKVVHYRAFGFGPGYGPGALSWRVAA